MAEAGNRKSKTGRKKNAAGRKTKASSAVNPLRRFLTGSNGVKYKRMETLRAHVIVHGLVQGVWFRASTRDEAVRIGVRFFWMQEGIESEAAREMLTRAGIPVVMDRCIMKEIARRRP